MGIYSTQTKKTEIIIGVTGHRQIDENTFVSRNVVKTLQNIPKRMPELHERNTIVLNALAEGADALVAGLALAMQPRKRLHVMLPFHIREYQKDMQTWKSFLEFHSLLGKAESITIASTFKTCERTMPACFPDNKLERGAHEDRNAAYERCGRQIVDQCDALLAIWDGMAARGRGGAAEIVAYARHKHKPLAWISSQFPCKVTYENFGRLKPRNEEQQEE